MPHIIGHHRYAGETYPEGRGAQGPQGAVGAQGPQGAVGAQGPQGDAAPAGGLLSWTTDDGDAANGFPRLFNAPNGVIDEGQNQYPVPYNCTVSQLTCRSTKGNVAASTTITVRKATAPGAGVNQTLTATIAIGTSLATDNVNSFTANQGDMISITNIDAIGAGEWIVCSVRLTPT